MLIHLCLVFYNGADIYSEYQTAMPQNAASCQGPHSLLSEKPLSVMEYSQISTIDISYWSMDHFSKTPLQIHLSESNAYYNSLFTRVFCLWPFQTVWTQIRSNKMSSLIWIQTVWHSDDTPERIPLKRWYWKKISRRHNTWKITQHAEINPLTVLVVALVGDLTCAILFVGLCHMLYPRCVSYTLSGDFWVTFWAWFGNVSWLRNGIRGYSLH